MFSRVLCRLAGFVLCDGNRTVSHDLYGSPGSEKNKDGFSSDEVDLFDAKCAGKSALNRPLLST